MYRLIQASILITLMFLLPGASHAEPAPGPTIVSGAAAEELLAGAAREHTTIFLRLPVGNKDGDYFCDVEISFTGLHSRCIVNHIEFERDYCELVFDRFANGKVVTPEPYSRRESIVINGDELGELLAARHPTYASSLQCYLYEGEHL